ncbi:MAG: AAA domain-containing protein [Candidatus Symbiodolus clandestinus]
MDTLSVAAAGNLLSAWTALEVLSPRSFQKTTEFVVNDSQSIINFDLSAAPLPWEAPVIPAPKEKQFFYQVVIGALKTAVVDRQLQKQYSRKTDLDEEPRQAIPAAQRAILAVALVNHQGYLLKNFPSVSLSSFAWGVPLALQGKLAELGRWHQVETELLMLLDTALRPETAQGEERPIDKLLIQQVYHTLVSKLQLPEHLLEERFFAIRETRPLDDVKEPPAPLLLNSFFIDDLNRAKSLLDKEDIGNTLKRYLGIRQPEQRINLLTDAPALMTCLAPQSVPLARWPRSPEHSLVLLQQAAVNIALNQLSPGDILAINGPPGSGKTTLLGDIIAGLVSQRAEVLCRFADPTTAFTRISGHKGIDEVKCGQGKYQIYQIDPRLRGFELLCASSNNKAVENISCELPALKSVATYGDQLHYFRALSNNLLTEDSSWGLIAATLGSNKNCQQFSQAFWWDDATQIKNYLKYIIKEGKTDKPIDIIDEQDSSKNRKQHSSIILQYDPPLNQKEALRRWQQIRKRFQEKLAKTQEKLAELTVIYQLLQTIEQLTAGEPLDPWKIEADLDQHRRKKLGWFSCWFHPIQFYRWRNTLQELTDKQQRFLKAQNLKNQCQPAYQQLGPQLIDLPRLRQLSAEIQQSVPWCDAQLQQCRTELFIAAMQLQKAFIDAAAKPIYHNLGIFIGQLTNSYLLNSAQQAWLPDLWSSFSLVVPCFSSTFASVKKLLGAMPADSLGWLLIDEAGQATPQMAVGALLRSQRAIIVGDPLQIEPIIKLPKKLTLQIFQHFKVELQHFNTPEASVQTVADRASAYYAEYANSAVGLPLLVHRRCSQPMFHIANRIAYQEKMIQAKRLGPSSIRDVIGPSCWFDITDETGWEEKWVPAEGDKLVTLLCSLPPLPDLYIISPFKSVVRKLRIWIKGSGLLQRWGLNQEAQKQWLDNRLGTVHQVQGKEAEAVFMVLGAPASNQQGSRQWAGEKPNLLNVALTRAKEVFYVIGHRQRWGEAGFFRELDTWVEQIKL